MIGADQQDLLRARVFARCEPDTNGGCWLWTGCTQHDGYGHLKVSEGDREFMRLTHRIAFGLKAAHGLIVRHKCDVRTCCNPAHLVAGTHADNMADMRARGRHKVGDRAAPMSGAEMDLARSLRQRGEALREIARQLGRDKGTIRRVVGQ